MLDKVYRFVVGATLALLGIGSGSPWAQSMTPENTGPNVNIVRWSKGAYEYRATKSGRTRGWEQWKLFTYRDGSRSMIMWHDLFARNTQFISV